MRESREQKSESKNYQEAGSGKQEAANGSQHHVIPAKAGIHSTVIPAKAGIRSTVIPAKAGIHAGQPNMDPRFRGDDGDGRDDGDSRSEDADVLPERGMGRREALGVMAMVPVVAAWDWGGAPVVERAARAAEDALANSVASGAAYSPKFFTAHEWKTVRMLADMVIPRDERSGSASEAGVPEFMDFMMTDRPSNQLPMRGGLAWLDAECRRRWKKSFVACSAAERTALVDDIAWPDKAAEELSQGVAFFNRFRDLTASGFFSSKMGVADLRYKGNTVVPVWKGCPDEALAKLGVSYGTKWDTNGESPSKGE